MNKGINFLPIIPVRSIPSDASEMTTQVLFGETYEVLREESGWVFVKLDEDDYEGWIDKKMLTPLSGVDASTIESQTMFVSPLPLIRIHREGNMGNFFIPAGSLIRGIDNETGSFAMAGAKFFLEDGFSGMLKPSLEKIRELAERFLNSPYLWGGKTVLGFDCSGLTQVLMKILGVNLPRDSRKQAVKGSVVSFAAEAMAGDLAFFDNQEGRITHTGFLLDRETILHSSGQVRIDRFDHQGIFNTDTGRYTHRLRIIRRFF